MSNTHQQSGHDHARPRIQRVVFAAALLLSIGGALAAPVKPVQGAAEGQAGEAEAHVYHAQNPGNFTTQAPLISSARTMAALAEGEREKQVFKQVRLIGAAPASK